MNYSKEELVNHSVNLLELIEDIVEYYCDENESQRQLISYREHDKGRISQLKEL